MKLAMKRSLLPFSPTFLLRLATIAASALLGVRGVPEPLLAVATPENGTNVAQKIAQSTEADDATPLGEGITTGTIAPGQVSLYKVTLGDQEYIKLAVGGPEIEIELQLMAPDGTAIAPVNTETTADGHVLEAIAPATGTYTLEITAIAPTGEASEYQVRIVGRRSATEADRDRLTYIQFVGEGMELFERATLESYREAIAKWEAAIVLAERLGDRLGQGLLLQGIGKVYHEIGEVDTALTYYQKALEIRQEIGDLSGTAQSLNNIGAIYWFRGDYQRALENLERSLPLYQQVENTWGEAEVLNNIGQIYADLRESDRALEYLNRALILRQELGDRRGEGSTLNNIAGVYSHIGENETAFNYYQQALEIRREIQDPQGIANTLTNLAVSYAIQGKLQQALDLYEQVLQLQQTLGDRLGEAVTYINLGQTYLDLGDRERALALFERALPMTESTGYLVGKGAILNNIAGIYANDNQRDRALPLYRKALAIARQIGDRAEEANILSNIGSQYLNQQNLEQALDYYQQGLSLAREVSDRQKVAIITANLGTVYQNLGQWDKARQNFNQALEINRQLGNFGKATFVLFGLATLDRQQGDLEMALERIEEALNEIEDVRSQVNSEQLRSLFFAEKQDYYELYIDILMELHQRHPDKGYDIKAFEASEAARARSLLEILNETQADIRAGVDPQLLDRETEIKAQLDARERQRIELLALGDPRQQVGKIESEIDRLLEEYNAVLADIRANSPRYAALTQPQPLSLEQIQREVLDDETILLEYFLGGTRSYLWVVTNDRIASYELASRETIEQQARIFSQALTDPRYRFNTERIQGVGAELSETILAPVAEELGDRRLLVVGDGALQYVPFAALPHPNRTGDRPVLLIEEHEIVTLPSASTLALLRRDFDGRAIAPKRLAIFADPVFSATDDRVVAGRRPTVEEDNSFTTALLERSARMAGVDFARLPYTRSEAEAILNLVAPNQREAAFDFEVNKNSATSDRLSQYQIIHFATHGILNSEQPELSGLVLSLVEPDGDVQNGFLRLHEVYNLNLQAELVVLSACETGLGQQIRGEGIVGLTRGFMYAGAKRVAVSLWSVDDRATADLMARFYRQMLGGDRAPAAALRAAQLELLNSEEWRSPYYWAAFGIQGEWR
ncbi:tetratricopeptide repeat protein [Oxynema sp. CENA135]|uniref:CHAT domain-containing tetratricopeptide repeat protein n=1 Tax=Oxynema sp. CENA135 TaxID=984206 RepID=UPI001F19F259|nr:tetratricopeptide repeat protein [Oxynema sp. CENA135]